MSYWHLVALILQCVVALFLAAVAVAAARVWPHTPTDRDERVAATLCGVTTALFILLAAAILKQVGV